MMSQYSLITLHFLIFLFQDNLPSLYRHFQDIGIEAHMYASQWFITLFTSKFPLPLVYSIMDLIFCEVRMLFDKSINSFTPGDNRVIQ